MTTSTTPPADFRSLTALFRSRVAAHPGQEAVVLVTDPDRPDGTDTLTYEQLDAKATAIATRLRETCLPEDRVLLLYPSGPEFVAAFLGCLYAGMIAVPAPIPSRRDNRQERRRLTGIVSNAGVRLVLTLGRDQEQVKEWFAEEELSGLRCEPTDHLEPAAAKPEILDAGPGTIAFLQYTSGSTGEPKGVVLTHRNLVSNLQIMRQLLGIRTPRPRVCSWLPLHHDMGLVGTVLYPLVEDGTCVLLDPATFLRQPYWWLRTMDRFQASVSAAPSFAYALCTERITDTQLAQLDLSHIERLGNGAEKIDAGVMKNFLTRFEPAGLRSDVIGPSYGLAEATLAVSVKAGYDPTAAASGPDAGRFAVSCGPVSHLDLRIVDPATTEVLDEGNEGEIWLRGPSVASGYWGRAEETRWTFRNFTADGAGPFLRTGDLGVLQEGELYVNGRIKDVIVVNGQKIYPQDIEHELRAQHPELSGLGAVFTVPSDETLKQDPVTVVHEIDEGHADRLGTLADDMRHTAAKEFGVLAESVVFVRQGSIPRTPSGKVKRAEARDLYVSGALDLIQERKS
ncbi:fatty acyl-AMP ligase [Amycolatopsis japonica]|uniref:fatty acyl-AMP ligase n=1 Tax=Amycolatopsis japonica TaxID=208439 RepID=UPI00366BED76